MTFPALYEHRFTLEGESYLLVGWTRASDRRIKTDFAMAIAPSPDVLDTIDGPNLYAEAVARECLKEAPDLFWETRSAPASTNGSPSRAVTFEKVSLDLWEAFRKEVDAFVAHFRPTPTQTPDLAHAPGAGEPDALAALETVPARLSGRAE